MLLFLLFPGEGEQKSGWFSAGPYVEVGEFYRRHFARLKTSPGNFRIAQHSSRYEMIGDTMVGKLQPISMEEKYKKKTKKICLE